MLQLDCTVMFGFCVTPSETIIATQNLNMTQYLGDLYVTQIPDPNGIVTQNPNTTVHYCNLQFACIILSISVLRHPQNILRINSIQFNETLPE